MTKEGIGGVFGTPKPLRTSLNASDRLEEDASAMETRLIQLRVTMQEEKNKLEAALPPKHAGNRWRSAREDRGGVRQYARDVEQRSLKKKEASKAGSKKMSNSSSRKRLSILNQATVENWTVPQVLEWLKSIDLEECLSGFEFHQVTGKMLLELSREGYEKLGVGRLSVYNRLLVEMDQLRARQVGKETKRQKDIKSAELIDFKLEDTQAVSEILSPSKFALKAHWSHIAPLAENSIKSGDEPVPVNLADGDFKEEANHASFLEALLEWRESDADQVAMSNQDKQEQEEWINPINSGKNEEKNGGALLEGSYDEVEAHNSFQVALRAWRSGSGAIMIPLTAPVEQTESSCSPGERQSCWQCYRIVRTDELFHDRVSNKSFCGATCQEEFCAQYARFYKTSS